MDKNWKEVMDLAEKHGFIIQAYGGRGGNASYTSGTDRTLRAGKIRGNTKNERKDERTMKINRWHFSQFGACDMCEMELDNYYGEYVLLADVIKWLQDNGHKEVSKAIKEALE